MALEYKSQHVSDEKKNATSISENITVRRFITSGSLHYFSKARDYSTEPLQWSSSNAVKLKMMYHRAKKINSESNKNLYKYILMCIIKCENNRRIYSQTKNYLETKYYF